MTIQLSRINPGHTDVSTPFINPSRIENYFSIAIKRSALVVDGYVKVK